MEVNIKIAENDQEKELVLSIRRIVFIQELNIPEYMEIDDNEESAISFYEKLGFDSIGPRFDEVGIAHQKMTFPIVG